eukprot:TRINITY_DN74986_c0_g1_i1.p1 TRINITY_DN74986_c0_g1~~TRINITY_DN74986_c0_g1_i1.p1  ORF type:complete len:776 (+),score=149.86 TRINITY_DN74986_c0_g1_i1:186-2330(+)
MADTVSQAKDCMQSRCKLPPLAAGEAIRACMSQPGTLVEKAACMRDDGTMAMIAEAMGINDEDVTPGMISRVARDAAAAAGELAMQTCLKDAPNEVAKQICRTNDDVKQAIANATGMEMKNLSDSYIREVIREKSQDDALIAMADCTSTDDCLARAQRAMARAMGVDVNSAGGLNLEMGLRDATAREVATRLRICMTRAKENINEIHACRDQVKAVIQSGDPSRTLPSKTDVAEFINRAALLAVSDALDSCDANCEATVKNEIAIVFGKSPKEISRLNIKSAVRSAATRKAATAAEACQAAREDKSESTCENMYEVYLKTRGGTRLTGTARKIDEEKVKLMAAEQAGASAKRLCCKKTNGPDIHECLTSAQKRMDVTIAALYMGRSESMVKERKLVDSMSTTSAAGGAFSDCMQAAITVESQKVCLDDMTTCLRAANVTEDVKSVMQHYRGKQIADAAASCGTSEAMACRQTAREDMKRAGMEEREYRVVKLLGAVKSASLTWATCQEAGESDRACDSHAIGEYLLTSGAQEAASTDKVKSKVRDLGTAIMTGVDTVLRMKKAVDIGVSTDEAVCTEASKTRMFEEVKQRAADFDEGFAEAKSENCVLVDGQPEYVTIVQAPLEMPDADIESASSAISSGMKFSSLRRLNKMRRRLAKIGDVFAAQSMEECSVDDNSCGSQTGQPEQISGVSRCGSMLASSVAFIHACVVLVRV